jgi:hypothetical protein
VHWIVWLFALFGLAGVAALIFIAVVILNVGGRAPEPARIAGERPEESFSVRGAEPLAGTSLIRIDIAAAQSGSSGSSAYSGSGVDDLRNILLLDRTSGAARRLLPDNRRRIERAYFLPARADFAPEPDAAVAAVSADEDAPPPAYYVLLVEQPGRRDRIDVLVGTLASGQQAYVMAGLEGVDSVWMHGPATIGFLVREQLSLHYRIVDIGALRVVETRRLAI